MTMQTTSIIGLVADKAYGAEVVAIMPSLIDLATVYVAWRQRERVGDDIVWTYGTHGVSQPDERLGAVMHSGRFNLTRNDALRDVADRAGMPGKYVSRILNQREWDSDTLDAVAEALRYSGYAVEDEDAPCIVCGAPESGHEEGCPNA
jgi:hypothetical protein